MSAPSAAASPAAASARKDLGLRALDGAFACHPTLPLTVLTLVIRMSRLRPEHRALIVYNWQTQQIVGTSTSLLGPPPKEESVTHRIQWRSSSLHALSFTIAAGAPLVTT
jgi:hypothetical protein